jgi:hypothetical protein
MTMANEQQAPRDDAGARAKRDRESYIHPESLGPPEKLDADLEDVINLFDHNGTEDDEPDIESDAPAP